MNDIERLVQKEAVVNLLVRYARAIDTHDWSLLDTVFTPDADCDYGEAGGFRGPYPEIRAWLQEALGPMDTQHMLTNFVVGIDGNRASAACYLQAEHRVRDGSGESFFTFRGMYSDVLTRSDADWVIEARTLRPMWKPFTA